jgi:transcriptional regulator with XRE-family HTH domain
MNDTQILTKLRERCDATSQRAVAGELGISEAYLSDLLHGNRQPGPKVLQALGYKRSVEIVRAEGAK